jgi:pimeloyl-ACP methyl ester carboxylesterase
VIVFVHGVPETAALWKKVRTRIDADSVALSMPGFGCPRPSGFGATHDDYVWHPFAQTWQTAGDGEAWWRDFNSQSTEPKALVFEGFGVSHGDAVEIALATDDTMASCILDLYRSATPNPYAHWKDAWGPTTAPGLVLCPIDDPFDDERRSREVAESLGAEHRTLGGAGHSWPLTHPEASAGVLRDFLASVC